MKFDSRDLDGYGTYRGGIDERWIASTTFAMNEILTADEGLSYVVSDGQRFTLREAIEAEGPRLIGHSLWNTYHRSPVYSKFFDNLGPIPHHLHQGEAQAQLVGREGEILLPSSVERNIGNFPHTYFGLEPVTSKDNIRRCLERWDEGDNGILDLSKSYRLKPGTGWLVPPRVLHSPGSLLTFEPQWGSDVLSMFQSRSMDVAEYGIKTAIEPIRVAETSMGHTVTDTKRYIKEVAHLGVANINGDIYHMQSEESHLGEAILDAGDQLINLHFCWQQSALSWRRIFGCLHNYPNSLSIQLNKPGKFATFDPSVECPIFCTGWIVSVAH